MLKYLSISICFFSLLAFNYSNAQTFVSTEPSNRIVVFEQFTGINNELCPYGHEWATFLEETYDNFQIMNIHSGGFAIPSTNQPDYRSEFGDELNNIFEVYTYPSASLNRITLNDTLVFWTNYWLADNVESILAMPSPVNLGIETIFNSETRELTINAEFYYTGEAEGETNTLHINLLESGIIGPQVSLYAQGATVPDYEHNHMLRTQITGMLGEEFATGEQFISKTYNYIVPEEYVIENCEVLAYVSETENNIYTGQRVKATGGTTLVIGDLTASSDSQFFNTPLAEILSLDFTSTNLLPQEENFTISITSEEAPETWNSNLIINGEMQEGNTIITSLSSNEILDISVEVLPCIHSGLATYTLSITSNSNPTANVLTKTFSVISGVRDLVISNEYSQVYEAVYTDLLATTEKTQMATMNSELFLDFKSTNATGEIKNIYYNIGRAFPPFSDSMGIHLMDFLDNGGNLLIAGQDIGWAIYNSEILFNYQTEINADFYENYMQAQYIADGSIQDTEANFTTNDEWFGNIGTTNIIDVYGSGYQYPEHIVPIGNAVPIMTLGNGDVGALKVETETYKLVYLGISFEQMEDQTVAAAIVQATHDWFYDGIEPKITECFALGIEQTNTTSFNLNQNYPNPADQIAVIEFTELSEKATFQLFDFNGRLMMEESLAPFTQQITLNTAKLAPGFYSYRLQTAEGVSEGRKMQVIH